MQEFNLFVLPVRSNAANASSLKSKVDLFNKVGDKHEKGQAVNPFSNDKKCGSLPKPVISKDEYGRPPKGSLSETRGFKANALLCREMLQLCEIINEFGEPLSEEDIDDDDEPRAVISFGELFSMYASISNKVVGVLLRARKHKLIDFEGEILFQRRDDDVPIFMMKPIEEIRTLLKERDETFDPPEKLPE